MVLVAWMEKANLELDRNREVLVDRLKTHRQNENAKEKDREEEIAEEEDADDSGDSDDS